MAGGGILLAVVLCGAATAAPQGAAAPGAGAASQAASAGLNILSLITAAVAPLAIGLIVWRRWYRLPGAASTLPMSPPLGLGLFITMFVLGLLGVKVAQQIFIGDTPVDSITDLPLADHTRLLMGHVVGQGLGAVCYLWLCRPAARSRLPMAGSAAMRGLLTMIVVWPIVAGVSLVSSYVAQAIQGEPVDVIAHDTLSQMAESPWGPWLAVMAIQVVFVVPLLEEVMYRGILQRTLTSLDLGRWMSIIITSAVFVAMHWGVTRWHALPALFVLSLGFGWVYERTGRLAAPIAMHVLFNGFNFALARLATIQSAP